MGSPQEQAAGALADVPGHVWDGASLPVPVERIAEACYGLYVRDVPPSHFATVPGAPEHATLSGLLLVNPKQIWVNGEEGDAWPGRRRFTIGHEVGHWVLHRPKGPIFCRTSSVLPEAEGEPVPPAEDIEEQASSFASALMFPPPLLREHHAEVGGDLAELCERFGASRAATERAIVEHLRRPLLATLGDAVRFFHYDDESYQAWRQEHLGGGFILNDGLSVQDDSRLHRADCFHLARPAREGRPATRHPKWCAGELAVLREVAPAAPRCSHCRPS